MTTKSSAYSWLPPTYDLSTKPKLRYTFAIDDERDNENFARSVRWTPDGSMFMAHCENRTLESFFISPTSVMPTRPNLILQQSAPILDFTWFPTASPNNPSSFCFLASVRESPVKLLDASDGRLRASYKIIDHRERFVAPHCMTFNLSADKIYCGHEDAIEVFDVSQPGEGSRIATTSSRKSKDGLKGIVSSIAFSPSHSADSDAFFAAGTLNPTLSNLALYNVSQSDAPLAFIGGGERSAVTQLRFNPTSPHILYAAYRRREAILAWDLRSDVNIPFARYMVPNKPVTNQKMFFDLDISGTRLAAGDQIGNLHIFDLNVTMNEENSSEMVIRKPDITFAAHSDSIGSVAFHPHQPLLLSVSGSRHYRDINIDSVHDSNSSSEEEMNANGNDLSGAVTDSELKRRMRPIAMDSSCKTWWFGANDSSRGAM